MKTATLFLLAILPLWLLGCSGGEPPSPLTVSDGGNRYRNDFFGVTVEKPEGWYAQDPEETIALQQRGTAVLAGGEEGRQALLESALQSSLPLFGFFAVAPGTPGVSNANVLGVAENLTPFPGVQSGCDYLHHVQRLLEQGELPYRFSDSCTTLQLDGRSLGLIEGRVSVGEVHITQRYYALIQRPYALAFVQTYYDEAGREKSAGIIDSLRFDSGMETP
jgi:hypothetical protein